MKHTSYSQHSSYKKCPRSWYLAKIIKAPERPAWYTCIGSAVHGMVEDWLGGEVSADDILAERYFYPLVSRAMEREPDTSQWMFSKDGEGNPLVEERALEHVKRCFERALEILDDIDVWEVEYDASGHLPGCEVEIKAFLDIVGEHKKRKKPVIVDWKTGKHKDRFQLDTYAALLKSSDSWSAERGTYMGMRDFEGYFAMLAPWAPQSRYLDLSAVNPAEIGAKYQDTYESMRAKIYSTTNTEAVCGFCFQRDNCLLRSEDKQRAMYYDRSSEDGFPF